MSFIAALFLAWNFYQQARNKERMLLIEKGMNPEEIFRIQKKNKFEFVFPWLKLGVVTLGMSISFLAIAFLILLLDQDQELFKGFLITFIIGFCLGVSLIVNHFITRKEKNKDG